MQQWVVTSKRADFKEIGSRFGIDQVTARIIRNRDVVGEDAIEQYLPIETPSYINAPFIYV